MSEVDKCYEAFKKEAERCIKANETLGPEYASAKFNLSMVVPNFSSNSGWRRDWDAHVFQVTDNDMKTLTTVMNKRKETEGAEREFLDLLP
jgi:hypothetical protein